MSEDDKTIVDAERLPLLTAFCLAIDATSTALHHLERRRASEDAEHAVTCWFAAQGALRQLEAQPAGRVDIRALSSKLDTALAAITYQFERVSEHVDSATLHVIERLTQLLMLERMRMLIPATTHATSNN